MAFSDLSAFDKLLLLGGAITSARSRDSSYMDSAVQGVYAGQAQQQDQQQRDILAKLVSPQFIGTPATKAFQVNGRTVGQNAPAQVMQTTPDAQLRALAQMPGFREAALSKLLSQRFAGPAKPIALGEKDRLIDPNTGATLIDAVQTEKEPKLETIFDSQGREIKVLMQADGSYKPVGGAKSTTENVAQWRPMTEAEKRERNLDANSPYKIDARTGNYELVSTGTKFNNDQNKAAGYANTMADAEDRINNIGFDPTSKWEAVRGASNITATPEYQKYKQGAMDWTLALLRHESGANVPDTEAEKYWTTYFPQVGDSPEVIKQKAESRASKMRGVVAASGGAFESVRKTESPTRGTTGTWKEGETRNIGGARVTRIGGR